MTEFFFRDILVARDPTDLWIASWPLGTTKKTIVSTLSTIPGLAARGRISVRKESHRFDQDTRETMSKSAGDNGTSGRGQ